MKTATIPKVELHCHLDGIVDPGIVREIQRRGQQFPISVETLEALYPVQRFDDFMEWGRSVVGPLEGALEHFKPILDLHIERLKSQHVIYTEIMIGSSEIPRDRSELVETVREFRDWGMEQEHGEIQVEFLIAFGRHKTPEAVEELADRILMLYEAGLIVGVALAGVPEDNPVKPFRKTFERFREAGLGVEIHAGEWCGPESVWDALQYGHPNRIGHGVTLFQDHRLVQHIQEQGIHIEMCPTSNVKTGSINRIDEHPIGQARALGMSVSINTDDPGIFECSLESEFRLVEQVFGFRDEDFERMRADALSARFQPVLRYLGANGEATAVIDRGS